MLRWKSFPKSTWLVTDEYVAPVGLGLKPHGLAYAVDDSKFLNGRVSADFEIKDELSSFGLVARANLAWSFMGCVFSNYNVQKGTLDKYQLSGRVIYVRNGVLQTLKTVLFEENLRLETVSVEMIISGASLEAQLTTHDRSLPIKGKFPHAPFPGSAGIVSIHHGGFRCSNYRATVEGRPVASISKAQVRVFLCHSSSDKDRVRELSKALAREGIAYWLDEEKIGPGDPVVGSISEGLESCSHIMPFLSDNLGQSGWARAEYESILNIYITDKSKRILPVYHGSIESNFIPILMRDLRRINIADPSQLAELIGALNAFKGQQA